jgi:hypothetical protein
MAKPMSPQRRRGRRAKQENSFAAFLVLLCALCVSAVNAFPEIIDQIAVTVNNQVITASQIRDEIRVTGFLNGEKPDFSAANRRRTADRLIEQVLVRREMDLTRYSEPGVSEIRNTMDQIRSGFQSDAALKQALAGAGITQAQLQDELLRQAALLRFIDLRFRPEVQIDESEVTRYCQNVYLPALRKRGVAPEPTLDSVRPQCEEEFTAQLVDRRVDAWLKEARDRSDIVYEKEAFP